MEYQSEISSDRMEFMKDSKNGLQAEVFQRSTDFCVWIYPIPTRGITIHKESAASKNDAVEKLQEWINDHYDGEEYIS